MIPEVHILINDYGYSNNVEGNDIVNVFENFDDAYQVMMNEHLEFIHDCDCGEQPDFIDYSSDINERLVIVKSATSDAFERWIIETHLVVQHKNED